MTVILFLRVALKVTLIASLKCLAEAPLESKIRAPRTAALASSTSPPAGKTFKAPEFFTIRIL